MKYLVGNWKMNGSIASASQLMLQYESLASSKVQVIAAVPYVHINKAKELAVNTKVAGQDCASSENGAYTGDISAAMLKDAGADYVILGHSERRKYHKEDEPLLTQKLNMAKAHNLTPILCVGEELKAREEKSYKDVISNQMEIALSFDDIIIAYEPCWSIGTGLVPSNEEIEEVLALIKQVKPGVPVLYGGSVNGANASSIASISLMDGFLVGGASLKFEEFSKIHLAISK
jgi:triosephosphate isomerase